MAKIHLASVVLVTAVLAPQLKGSWDVESLHSPFALDRLTFLPELIGDFAEQPVSPPPVPFQLHISKLNFENDDPHLYEVTDGHGAKFIGATGRIGTHLYLDLQPEGTSSETKSLPLHQIWRIEIKGDELRVASLSFAYESLFRSLPSGRIDTGFGNPDSARFTVITATQMELQSFLERNDTEDRIFGSVYILRKPPKPNVEGQWENRLRTDPVRRWLRTLETGDRDAAIIAATGFDTADGPPREVVMDLTDLLGYPDPAVRQCAAEALADYSDSVAALPALLNAAASEDRDLSARAGFALARMGPPAIQALIADVANTPANRPTATRAALAGVGSAAIQPVMDFFGTSAPGTRASFMPVFRSFATNHPRELLSAAAGVPSAFPFAEAALFDADIAVLQEALQDPDPKVRNLASRVFSKIYFEEYTSRTRQTNAPLELDTFYLHNSRLTSLEMSLLKNPKSALAAASSTLDDRSAPWTLRRDAALALRDLAADARPAIPILSTIATAGDEPWPVRRAASEALRNIGGLSDAQIAPLRSLVGDSSVPWPVRESVALTLTAGPLDIGSIPVLSNVVSSHAELSVRLSAVFALGTSGASGLEALRELTSNPTATVRALAAIGSFLGGKESTAAVTTILSADPDSLVQKVIATGNQWLCCGNPPSPVRVIRTGALNYPYGPADVPAQTARLRDASEAASAARNLSLVGQAAQSATPDLCKLLVGDHIGGIADLRAASHWSRTFEAANALAKIGGAHGACEAAVVIILKDEFLSAEFSTRLGSEPPPPLPLPEVPADQLRDEDLTKKLTSGFPPSLGAGGGTASSPLSSRLPIPSASYTFNLNLKTGASLGDAHQTLSNALKDYRFGTFEVPEGFVIVLQPFQIDRDARPTADRYTTDRPIPHSFGEFLRELVLAPPGQFEMLLFVVSKSAVVESNASPWSFDYAWSLFLQGTTLSLTDLDSSLAAQIWNGHFLHVLAYYYVRPLRANLPTIPPPGTGPNFNIQKSLEGLQVKLPL
jgi:HEAT repeat protein